MLHTTNMRHITVARNTCCNTMTNWVTYRNVITAKIIEPGNN